MKIKVFEKINDENRYIYATFIEKAFHNFFVTLQHIFKLIKGAYHDITDDDFGKIEIFKEFKMPDEIIKLKKLYYKYFPFLKAINDDAKVLEIIEKFWGFLKLLRNGIEHTKVKFDCDEKLIINCLGKIKDNSKVEVKKRFSNTIIRNYWVSYKEDNKVDDSPKHVSICGYIMFICLFLENKYISLFLNQQSVSELFTYTNKKNKFDPNPTKEKFGENDIKNLYRCLCIYNINLPSNKYEAIKSTAILGLDMLNELQKCPDELFEHLSKEDKDSFRVIDSEDSFNEILMKRYDDRFPYFALKFIDDTKKFNDIRFQVSLGKYRYKFYDKQCIDSDYADRVRILQDSLNGFGRLDEIEKQRKSLWHNVIRKVQDSPDSANTKPYITDQYAQYLIDDNTKKIGLWWDNDKDFYLPISENEVRNADKPKNLSPKVFLSVYDLPTMMFLMKLGGNTEEVIKNTYNNYQKLFNDIELGQLNPSNFSEQILKENYEMELIDLPNNLKNYLTNNVKKSVVVDGVIYNDSDSLVSKRRSDKIKELVLRLKRFTDNINSKEPEKRKKVRQGVLASWLAKDIVSLINKDEIKPTGKNFNVLQANIAIYGSFSIVEKILKQAKIVDYHPFLRNVLANSPKKTQEFYKLYLKEEIEFFKKGDIMYLKSFKTIANKFSEKTIDYYKSIASNMISDNNNGCIYLRPIEMSGNFFLRKIREILAKNPDYKDIALAKNEDGNFKNNAYYLISKYFGEYQPFYDYKRNYRYFDIIDPQYRKDKFAPKVLTMYDNNQIKNVIKSDSRKKAIKKLEKDFELAQGKNPELKELNLQTISNDFVQVKNNEHIIARYKVEDMLTLWMAKTILVPENFENTDNTQFQVFDTLSLDNIEPNNNLLNTMLPEFSITMKFVDIVYETEHCKDVDYKPKYKEIKITQKNLKLKNYSVLYSTIFDRRLDTLAMCITEKDLTNGAIDHDDLKAELESYDRTALIVNKKIYDLVNNYNVKTNSDCDFKYISKKIIREAIKKSVENRSGVGCEDEINYKERVIKCCRNSFAHWSYPIIYMINNEKKIFDKFLTILKYNKLRQYKKDSNKGKIESIMNELESAIYDVEF